jgi:DNA (cytosine-5)-methyltransferase 1
MKNTSFKVIELFAGVGGFRLGLESLKNGGTAKPYRVIWSSQWEPNEKAQYASKIYEKRFNPEPGEHSNEDIATVPTHLIPDHDLLVGGFPCQDYSVATTLNQSKGIKGKKGVLWWQIHRILDEKSKKPYYLILENVDRLLRSPASQRGRDFAIILASLSDFGYIVEWRVINAAEYGFAQRRRRVFLMAYHKDSPIYKSINSKRVPPGEWILKKGVIAKAFKVQQPEGEMNLSSQAHSFQLDGDLVQITESFGKDRERLFMNTGIMIDRKVTTLRTEPDELAVRKRTVLEDVLDDEASIDEAYFIDDKDLPKWKALKAAKAIQRTNKSTGFKYLYSEGSMKFPDPLDQPSRTIITGEGGRTPSRFKHVIKRNGRLRRLTPRELEKLNGFSKDFTKFDGIPDAKRAFLMGNALVVDIVKRLGDQLYKTANGIID